MKFPIKRDDVGVYVTLTMFGAGAGMVVGAAVAGYIATRIFNKRFLENQEVISEEDNDEKQSETQRYQSEKGPEADQEAGAPWEVVAERSAGGGGSSRTDEERDHGGNRRAKESYDALEEKFQELTRNYRVTPIQLEMVRSQLLTIEDLEEELERTGKSVTGYSPPDIDEILDVEDADSRPFEILSTNPAEDPDHPATRVIELLYDPNEDRLVRLVAGDREIVVTDIHPYAIDFAQELIERDGFSVVYIWEHDRQKAYSFRLIT